MVEPPSDFSDLADLLSVAQGLYAFMRFVSSGLMMMKPFKPRIMLTVFLTLCIVFSIASIATHGTASVAMIILVLCFESVGESDMNRYISVTDSNSFVLQQSFH